MHTVVVTESLQEVCFEWLAGRTRALRCPYQESESFQRLLPETAGLVVSTYTPVDAAVLAEAPRLKVVGRAGVGLENVDIDACRRAGVRVVYTPEANTQAVAEYVLALMLDALRPRVTLSAADDADTFHRYRREQVGKQLDTLTLGVLGFGHIGRCLGRIAHAVGMRLLVNDLLPVEHLAPLVSYPFEFVDKPTLYQSSDVLSVHVDGRPENEHLVNRSTLDLLQPHCLLINASRGMVIDPNGVADWALSVSDTGGAAVLDVHAPEPPPPSYPLFGLPNVRLLPHIAARTDRALENMSWVVKDVWTVLQGKEPRYPAD